MTNEEFEQEKEDFRNFGMNILNPILSKKFFPEVYIDASGNGAWFYCIPRQNQYCFHRFCGNPELSKRDGWIDYRSLKAKGLNDQEILQEIIKYYNIKDMIEGE